MKTLLPIHATFRPLLALTMLGLLAAQPLATPAARAQATAALTTLHTFSKDDGGGQQPLAGLLLASDGNFYGTTPIAGNQAGEIYKITPDGTFSVIYKFTFNLSPDSELIQSSDGSIYGTANGSGGVQPLNGGIFRLSPAGDVSIVYYFDLRRTGEGGDPVQCGLTEGSDGNLYGCTTFGGDAGGFGTFYRLTPDGTVTYLHSFALATVGGGPQGRLVQATDGNFYGMCTAGGTGQRGTVFRLTPDGALTVLHTFTGSPADGSQPFAGLIQASDGFLYGTTTGGGKSNDNGTIFRISLDGNLTVLHSFRGTDGARPNSRLIQGADGNLYGAAATGGQASSPTTPILGTIFQMTLDGTFTSLHTFTGPDGGGLNGNLAQAADGSFYGTSNSANQGAMYGTIFRFTVSGVSHPGFFAGEVALGQGAYYLDFGGVNYFGYYFGYYSYLTDPKYVYHFDLGYEYLFPAGDGNDGIYFYDFASRGFLYTSPTFAFPYLYDFSLGSTVYYYPDPNNAGRYNMDGIRYFYVFSTGQIISK